MPSGIYVKHTIIDGIEGKICTACKIWQSLNDYFKRGKAGKFEAICKKCKKLYMSKHNKTSEMKEYHRNRYHNKEGEKERRRDYWQEPDRLEQTREYMHKYRQTPEFKEKKRIEMAERYARTKTVSDGTITVESWKELLDFYDNKCAYCGSTKNIHMDHIYPISKGGLHTIDNIQPLCASCNIWKKDKIV